MLTSDAYTTLTKVLGALRAHDTETIEALADPRLRNSRPAAESDDAQDETDAATRQQERRPGRGAGKSARPPGCCGSARNATRLR